MIGGFMNINEIKTRRDFLISKVKKNKQLRLKFQNEIIKLSKVIRAFENKTIIRKKN